MPYKKMVAYLLFTFFILIIFSVSSSARYIVQVGKIKTTDPLTWEYVGTFDVAEGTTEFDLASVGITSAVDISIEPIDDTYLDAFQNLHTNETIGYDGEGNCISTSIGSGNVDCWLSIHGPPDGMVATLNVGGWLYLGLDFFGGGRDSIVDEPGNDFKIYIGSQTSCMPYKGTGPEISEDDRNAIINVFEDLMAGYETMDSSLILKHVKDFYTNQVSRELELIFNYLTSIKISINDYDITGNLPYAEGGRTSYGSQYNFDDGEGFTGNGSDNCKIYFEKIGSEWKIYHFAINFNFHANFLCGVYKFDELLLAIDIKANDSDGPINIYTDETLSVKISLSPGKLNGTSCDWWIAASTPFGWYHYDELSGSWVHDLTVTFQGPLSDLSASEVLNMTGLPIGMYTFYFAIDTNVNGSIDNDLLHSDSVEVNITP